MFRRLWCVLPFLLIACNDSPPGPPPASSVQIAVEDVSCTEAWLRLSLTDSNEPRTVALKRDGQTVLTAQLTASDSILIDEGLLPNHSYIYQAVRMRDSVGIDASANTQVTTLDTTSHNWTFSIDTLGDASSVLYDVAIVNDTLAYAVGELYLRDSTGQIDPQAYNMAKWDGTTWELMRIQFYTFCGQSGTGSYPAKSLFAFSPTDIWIGMDGSQVVRWNGQSQSVPMCTPVSINKLWGEHSNSVWAVGNNGGIAHYTSGTWRRIESGTSVDIQDAWGGNNNLVGGQVVLLAASNVLTFGEKKLLRVSAAGVVDSITWGMDGRRLHSVWFSSSSRVFVSGGGVFAYTGGRWKESTDLPPTFTQRIRGNAENDVIVVGDFGLVASFNGIRWRGYPEFDVALWRSVDVKGSNVFAVGDRGGTARVLRMRR